MTTDTPTSWALGEDCDEKVLAASVVMLPAFKAVVKELLADTKDATKQALVPIFALHGVAVCGLSCVDSTFKRMGWSSRESRHLFLRATVLAMLEDALKHSDGCYDDSGRELHTDGVSRDDLH